MQLDWEQVVIDKRAVMADGSTLLEEWHWLIPNDSEAILPTACGDIFLRLPDDSIAFLDTYKRTCETVASNYEEWKAMLNDRLQLEAWFRGELIGDLLQAGLTRQPGQCFSPLLPQILSGSWEPSNFDACDLSIHLSMLGQIHRQVKDLPEGTKITGFDIEKQ